MPGVLTVEDAVNRSSENANRITLGGGARGVLFGAGDAAGGLYAGPGRRWHRPRKRPGPGSGHRRFPDFLHPPPDSRGPGRRHARAALRRGRRLQRHAVEARPRQPRRRRRSRSPRGCAPRPWAAKPKIATTSRISPCRPTASRWPSRCAARSTTSTTKTSRRPGTSGNTTSRPTPCIASSPRTSSPRKARTWRRPIYPTAASCSPRRASASPRPSCSTRTRRSSRPRPRRATNPPSCCTS